MDIVIKACQELDVPLKIFGDGVDLTRLKKIAAGSSKIEFLGRVSDQKKAELYSRAQAFINPQEEDFGITVIEAMASGRPVIAYGRGGARETVTEGVSGTFFYKQTEADLAAVIKQFKPSQYDPRQIRAQAQAYTINKFKENIKHFIEEEYRKFKENDL